MKNIWIRTLLFILFLYTPLTGISQTRQRGNKTKSATLGLNSSKGNEVGIIINTGRRGGKLAQLSFKITQKLENEARFKVNIYNLEGDFPGKNIVTDTIKGYIRKNEQDVSVDIKPYNVRVKGKNLVSIEWLETVKGNNPQFGAAFLNGGTWTKSPEGKWKKFPVIGVGFNVMIEKERS